MARRTSISSIFIVIFVISGLISIIGEQKPWTSFLPPELLELDLATRLHFDEVSTTSASTDFGKLITASPAAVLYPSSDHDIATLLQISYTSTLPFIVAARGHGHSIRGQALAPNGVVIEMHSLDSKDNNRINISTSGPDFFADVGGEQLWIDVLHGTLEHGLAPRSWTDYLYLTVGGTLSNAGVSGQAFWHGPQISNVYEMDVITGRGEKLSCSKHLNSELYYGVLGGLGQFGIITRARIALEPAPQRVKWIRLLYGDFSLFTTDQEQLVSSDERKPRGRFDYIEGSVFIDDGSLINNWRSSSFFSKIDHGRISSLAAQYDIIYCLELVKYYDNVTASTVDKKIDLMLKGLRQIPEFIFTKDVSYVDFLNRVYKGETELRSEGLWDVPHPWLNLFIPKSRIMEFDEAVFKGILKRNKTLGPILIYPMNRNRWDDRTSAVIPNEELFYTVGLLQSSAQGWESLEDRNKEILSFCSKTDIEIKQYLPHYQTMTEWKKHFGPKWDAFSEKKKLFDPKAILSPGQRIFTPLVGTFPRPRDVSEYKSL